MPCHPARARELLTKGKAAVFRQQPFTIILKDRSDGITQPIDIGIDPGSKTTGISLRARFKKRVWTVLFAMHLVSRSSVIRKKLFDRATYRRNRRSKLRYRPSRFDNRTKPKGWLAPSVQSLLDIHTTWIDRLDRLTKIVSYTLEYAAFDTHQMHMDIKSNKDYQHGTLFGLAVKQYLIKKYHNTCAYCDTTGTKMTIDHVVPRSKGGTDRVSNLVLACYDCNQRKGNLDIREYLRNQPTKLEIILKGLKIPLKGATKTSILSNRLPLILARHIGIEELTYGYVTQYNRYIQSYPKDHWIDASCTGHIGKDIRLNSSMRPLIVTAKGHGERKRVRLDRYGFPKGHKLRNKSFMGFQTGDIVRVVKNGISLVGRVMIRHSGYFDIISSTGRINSHYSNCTLLQCNDGYQYTY